MKCCSEYTSLGCLNACDPIDMGSNTTLDPYTLIIELDYNGMVTTQTITVGPDEPYLFDMPKNENYDYTGRIIYPDETFLCISFTTYAIVRK